MMQAMERKCSKCGTLKALERFSAKPLKDGSPGYQSECKDCRAQRERDRRQTPAWRDKNAERAKTPYLPTC
jgi:hypothetical protein